MSSSVKSSIKSKRSSVSSSWWYALNILALAGITFFALFTYGANEAGYLSFVRLTARNSAFLFVLAFSSTAILQLWSNPVTLWLSNSKKVLFQNFAISHFVHLAGIFAYFSQDGVDPAPIEIILVGGLGYFLIAALLATANNFSKRLLGTAWNRLHVFGVYYLWVVFAYSYYGRANKSAMYFALFSMMIIALGLRLVAIFKRKTKPST